MNRSLLDLLFFKQTQCLSRKYKCLFENLETQVGQLALNLPYHYRDSFSSDTKKNPKDCMAITLSSGKELQVIKEAEKRQKGDEAEKVYQNQAGS